ncbi:MAG: YihY/virulence factor BrkB family protein [Thermoleophilia bacterium]
MQRIGRAARVAMQLARRAVAEFFEDGCPQRAAAISYYSLLSLFPLAIVLVAVFGIVADDDAARRRVIEFVLDNVPLREDRGRADLEELLQSVTAAGGGFGALGVLGLLFAASAVMGAVRQALSAAWEVEDPRPPLQGKLVDLLLVLVVGLVIVASLAMTLALRLVTSIGERLGDLGLLAEQAVLLASGLVPALLAFAVCTVVFALVPAPRSGLRDTWPGVLVAVIGFEAAKQGFSLYLENAANYGAVYASLGGIVAFLVFVFIVANLFLLGAEAASEWPRVRDEPPPEPSDEPLKLRVRRALRRLVVRPPTADARDEADAAAGSDRAGGRAGVG